MCVGRALVRVTSRSFPTAAAAAAAPAPETFLRARTFCFLNKVQFSTLSAQSAGVSLKMGCESGKFMARKIEHLLLLKVALKCIPIGFITAGLAIRNGHTKNQFATRPRGLQRI